MPTKGLRKFLKTLSKEELIKHIVELDKKYKPVQEFHEVCLASDISELVEKHKEIIENEFFPSKGLPKGRLSVARKSVSDAKKKGFPPEAITDLMFFYVENGVEFINEFGDMEESFYRSMENMYQDALKSVRFHLLGEYFQDRAWKIIEKAEDVGWGFPEILEDYYHEYFL